MLATRDRHRAERWTEELRAAGHAELLPAVHSSSAARSLLARQQPVLLITEPQLQDGPATELVRLLQLRPRDRRMLSLVVSPCADDPALLDLLQAGADSLVEQSPTDGALVQAVRDTLAGGADILPWVAQRLLEHFGVSGREAGSRVEDLVNPLALSPEDRQLLRLLALGSRVHELAPGLGLGPRELTARVRGIYHKMQWALRAGDLSLA